MKFCKSLFCLSFMIWVTRVPLVRTVILGFAFVAFATFAISNLRRLIPMTPAKIEPVRDSKSGNVYGVLLADITFMLQQKAPEATWIWALPGNAQSTLLRGEETQILVFHAVFSSAKVRIDPSTYRISSFVTGNEYHDSDVSAPSNPEYVAYEWFMEHYQDICERIGMSAPEGHSLQLKANDLPDETTWKSIVALFVKERYGAEIIDGNAGIMIYF